MKPSYEDLARHNEELRGHLAEREWIGFLIGVLLSGFVVWIATSFVDSYIYARRVEAFLAKQGICEYKLNPKTGETEFSPGYGPVTIDSPLQTLWDARDITRLGGR